MTWIDVHVLKRNPLVQTMNPKTLAVTAKASIVFYCESDSTATLDQALVASANGTTIPLLNSAYSSGRPYCRCVQLSAEWVSPTVKHVTCEFEDPTDGSSSVGLCSQAAKIGEHSEAYQEAYPVDAEGNLVQNTAKQPFTNPPQRQAAIKVYTIEKFVNASTRTAIEAAFATNNDGSITIKGSSWSADELWLAEYAFLPVDGTSVQKATITIKCKRGGWKDLALNVGSRDVQGCEIKVKTDGTVDLVNGEPPGDPWPLASNGLAKAAGTEADQLTFWPYARASWSSVPVS